MKRIGHEVAAVWLLLGLVAVEILATYSRLTAFALYHVSGSGLAAGAGRALVFLNYPVALVAIAVLALVADRRRSRGVTALALLGVVLCAAVVWPGVVDTRDLDAKPVNAVATAGVALALVLTATTAARPSRRALRRLRGDRARLALATALLVIAPPWLAADLGFDFAGVPVLGSIYQTGELRSQPGLAGLHPAVHHGHHHGMDGVLLALCALLLSRTLGELRSRRLRPVLAAYLSLMLAYGVANVANDAWLEQVAKRGWTAWLIPDVTRPSATLAWVAIVVCAAAVWLLFQRSERGARTASSGLQAGRPR